MRIGEVGGSQAGLIQGVGKKTIVSLASFYGTCVVNRVSGILPSFFFYASICPSTFQSRNFRETSYRPYSQLAEGRKHIPSQRKCLEMYI